MILSFPGKFPRLIVSKAAVSSVKGLNKKCPRCRVCGSCDHVCEGRPGAGGGVLCRPGDVTLSQRAESRDTECQTGEQRNVNSTSHCTLENQADFLVLL